MVHTLTVSGLNKNYHSRSVVTDLNIDMSSGEIIGLLGPNGAGKTTTFYMIVGLIAPDNGAIFLDGEDISKLPMYKRAKKGISYLPQEPSIFRKLNVEDNLRAVLEIAGLHNSGLKTKLEAIMDEFKLTPLSKRMGHQLSGGERRRVEIARALTLDPFFILLDEPFAGIDPIAVIELKKTIGYLKDKGIGIIITDHNVRETLSITDRAYIINNGTIIADGSPEKLVQDEMVKKTYLGEDFTL
ncbi:MAG: LPS export ABC transporter ATP-binding protein [Nitrospirae bacterium]|nr:LPS export ABC transporter ATP-binding protein [Nitrospirota bacterium]